MKDHPLFKKFPLNGSATISTGEVPTPYHIYDGHGLFIGGTVDLPATRQLLQRETVVPIEIGGGRTPMGIWVGNFTDASLGPHHELQFSFFTARGHLAVNSHRLSLLTLMMCPEVQMLCHGLWNNTSTAVSYNRELLSLNSHLTRSQIESDKKKFSFNFRNAETGHSILTGTFPEAKKVSLRANWDVLTELGFKRAWRIARQPWMNLQILNPVGLWLDRNAVAETFTKNNINLVRYFDELTDHLQFGDTAYGQLGLKPQFVQYMEGFKFVYLHPSAGNEQKKIA